MIFIIGCRWTRRKAEFFMRLELLLSIKNSTNGYVWLQKSKYFQFGFMRNLNKEELNGLFL